MERIRVRYVVLVFIKSNAIKYWRGEKIILAENCRRLLFKLKVLTIALARRFLPHFNEMFFSL